MSRTLRSSSSQTLAKKPSTQSRSLSSKTLEKKDSETRTEQPDEQKKTASSTETKGKRKASALKSTEAPKVTKKTDTADTTDVDTDVDAADAADAAPKKTRTKRAISKGMPSGFRLIKDFITVEEEKFLFEQLEKETWTVDFTRKLQYYNYRNERERPYSLVPYKYKTPAYLEPFLDRLVSQGVMKEKPDQLIINNYLPGEGIRPHLDRKDYFKDQVCAITLMGGCTLQLMTPAGRYIKPVAKEERELYEMYIPRRSCYVLEGDARYVYFHAISGRKSDAVDGQKVMRDRRVSITCRNVIQDKVKRENIDTFD